jgi:hypothetical protein
MAVSMLATTVATSRARILVAHEQLARVDGEIVDARR